MCRPIKHMGGEGDLVHSIGHWPWPAKGVWVCILPMTEVVVRKSKTFLFLPWAVLFLLGACAGPSAREMAVHLRIQGGFVEQRFSTPHFELYGLLRPATVSGGDKALHVYMEGDGRAWESRHRPAADPTPGEPVCLRLAEADPSPGPVLYLARPCQYVGADNAALCQPVHWTAGRLSEEVIASLDAAVSMALQRTGAQRVVLVGYSGGGAAAALVAARRQDVVFLGSVAGVLDHAAWTAHHKVSPLRQSLNPAAQVEVLRRLPQRHMTSPGDAVVPPAVNAAYCRELGQGVQGQGCVQALSPPGMSTLGHGGAWERVWDYDYGQ